ncbi:MAG: hypothetical protein A2X30_09325 [Elusimicrobia bacterium GWB2_63_16]|nr:MAG: hypothetical protein A2X30_09325 [Elusimicrobia bacterium GWB2_63_16]
MSTQLNGKKTLVLFYNRRYHPVVIRKLLESGAAKADTVIVNLGEFPRSESLTAEIRAAGSENVVNIDGRKIFSENYISWAIRANACYQEKYYLSAAIARPCLAEITASLAKRDGWDTVVHEFRGNDMVRMNMGYQALETDFLPALSAFDIDEAEVKKTADSLKIPEEFGTCNPFSVSDNIWGRSIECGPLEDLEIPAAAESYGVCRRVAGEVSEPELVSIRFRDGVPVELNGSRCPLHEIIEALNKKAGVRGIGRYDLVEDGTVGFKTRAIYEHPAAACIIAAHKELEHLVLNKHELEFKNSLDQLFSKKLYDGLWFDPVMEHVKAALASLNQFVTGEIVLELSDKTFEIVKRSSPYSLYKGAVSVYNYGHRFSSGDAAGYGNTFNLHTSWTNKMRRMICRQNS